MNALPMLVARQIMAANADAPSPISSVTLDYDARYLRRSVVTCANGAEVLIDLPDATILSDGDRLVLEQGGEVVVEAAPEKLLDIREGDGGASLMRLAWHLGNRHLPTEIGAQSLRIRADHVIEDMLRGLGAEVSAIEAPFQPEGGAYGHGRTHGHSHG